jgi:hypothetical protein
MPMRKISAATVTLAAVAVTLAAPASADPVRIDQMVTGLYRIHVPDGSVPDMTFQATSCGIGCAQIAFANVSAQAQYQSDRWHVNFPHNPAMWRCPDGSAHAGSDQLAWFAATGSGTLLVERQEAACGYTDHSSETVGHPMTVTQAGGSGQPSALAPIAW